MPSISRRTFINHSAKWEDFRYHLYNVEEDPRELHDLIDDQKHKSVRADLLVELEAMWGRQRTFLPEEIPPPMPRVAYDISWPADPWEAVRPG